MRTDDFDFHLPPDLIAQEPAPRREDARLLVLPRAAGEPSDDTVASLPDLLSPGDLLVVNDTRVLRARLFARRATGGRVEVFLLHPAPTAAPDAWEALVRAGGALAAGEDLRLLAGEDEADGGVRLLARLDGGHWHVAPLGGSFDDLMARAGRMPLPPYIRRTKTDARDPLDAERYQTVYARHDGAVAAPTAGLHLTPAILARCAARGIGVASVTLHVGLGTFKPVETERIDEHPMHEEPWTVPAETAAALRRTRAAGGRIVAVGTTSVRTLESAALASPDGLPVAGSGATRLFISPGFPFRATDALLTNFHLPRSTLLCLVAAFAGRERVLAAYNRAVAARYRFFSYGDAMLVR